jgi:hypothetical protein
MNRFFGFFVSVGYELDDSSERYPTASRSGGSVLDFFFLSAG